MPTAEPRSSARGADRLGGIYVHVPFCARICPYCDFAVTVGDSAARRRLVEAIGVEATRVGPRFPGPADTVYFGGGTPSLLDPHQLIEILTGLEGQVELTEGYRVYLEANPEDVDEERLRAWHSAGVSTLSLGVQALEDTALDVLGRRHTVDEARRAVENALGVGFDTVSIDLIYSRPGQSVKDWRAELDAAVALGVQHLSCYQLTYEPGTPFGRRVARGRLVPLSAEVEADLLLATHEHLSSLGFDGYEVSNFARSPEHRSRHNQKYWRRAPYLGLGPSAHSFADGRRWWNERNSRRYVQAVEVGDSPVEGVEELTALDTALELLLLGLRCREGVDLGRLERLMEVDVRRLNHDRLTQWIEEAFVEIVDDRILPTATGMALAERLAAEVDLGVDRCRPASGG